MGWRELVGGQAGEDPLALRSVRADLVLLQALQLLLVLVSNLASWSLDLGVQPVSQGDWP